MVAFDKTIQIGSLTSFCPHLSHDKLTPQTTPRILQKSKFPVFPIESKFI